MARVRSQSIPIPTMEEIAAARQNFVQREPRHLFYRVAVELIDLIYRGVTTITLPEAIAVLLQTWNKAHYQYHKFTERHFRALEALIGSNLPALDRFRGRRIDTFFSGDESQVRMLFDRFEQELGPVGTAKTLHLFAPNFFPLWDRAIAKAYRFKLDGGASEEYVRFMRLVMTQFHSLTAAGATWSDMLKAIDEYNYCTYTLSRAVPTKIWTDLPVP